MEEKREGIMMKRNNLFMIVSFVIFIVTYYVTNNRYSSIIGLIYTLLITFQVAIFFYDKSKNVLNLLPALFFAAIMFFSIVKSKMVVDTRLSLFLLCSIVIFVGNLCSHIPYNPFIGIRIFSTRNDAGNWRATHHILASLSIPISCLILILSNFFNMSTVVTISFSVWLILPIVYSIWIYPRKGA